MKDKLLYLTIGLLIGIVVMQWTMPSGQASGVTSGSGIIAAAWSPIGRAALDDQGHVWMIGDPLCWVREENLDPPIPVSNIKIWGVEFFVTTDNIEWAKTANMWGPWVNCGPWPGGPVPTSPDTWGGVKGKYDANN